MKYAEIVTAFLDRMGVRVERRNPRIKSLMPDQFDRDAHATEYAHNIRMGNIRRIENNNDSLR